MPATDFPTPPLLATMARMEADEWFHRRGMPRTPADLIRFAEHIACMAGTVYLASGRARMAERRQATERSA